MRPCACHKRVSHTILQLCLLDGGHRDQATQSLRFPLLPVDFRTELIRLHAKLLSILLEGDKLVPPQVALCHQEV
jgi:hypothetical protein